MFDFGIDNSLFHTIVLSAILVLPILLAIYLALGFDAALDEEENAYIRRAEQARRAESKEDSIR